MTVKTAVLIGAGDRGARAYGSYALKYPNELKITALAEPDEERRNKVSVQHDLADHAVYQSWEQLLKDEKVADAAIICTLDKGHYHPAMKALELGYHVLLEKPMSPDPAECIELERASKKFQKQLTICHVLRYTEFWGEIKSIVSSGEIGDVVSIQLNENVEVMHMAHSFVRGNWNNKEKSSPMILQKSCHDLDIIQYIVGSECERISSYGSLMHFKEENKPENAPLRCLDGCPVGDECAFHAGRYYLGDGKGWAKKFTEDHSREGIIKALEETSYGKCVYQLDNNVVDHQVVNMEFQTGATATFSMCGFTRDQTRIVQIMGTKGEIRGDMLKNHISVFDFLTKKETNIRLNPPKSGHGGGDDALMKQFLHDIDAGNSSMSSASVSLQSHLMAFAAEDSRLNGGESILMSDYLYKKV